MTITLPEGLAGFLSELGFEFPKADEDKIAELGVAWSTLGAEINARLAEANTTATAVWDDSTGKDIDAFKTWWEKDDSPPKSLENGAIGAEVAGAALQVCALIVIGLKIHMIFELITAVIAIIAAVVAAFASGGTAAVAILAIKKVTKEAIGFLIEQAVLLLLEEA